MTDVGSNGAVEVTSKPIYPNIIIATYIGTQNVWPTVLVSCGEKSICRNGFRVTPAGEWNFVMWA
jgi:hypothetical protein